MKLTKNILFDVDGVLIDTMPIWANSANDYLLEVHGIDAPPEVDKNCETLSLLEAGEYILGLYPQIRMTPRQLADGVALFIKEKYVVADPCPYMVETVRKLFDMGYHLYLATASEYENVKGALTNLGVFDCFLDVYTCTEIGYSKSYEEYYKTVAGKIGVPCTDLTIIEDSLHSMMTAKKAGLNVIAVYEKTSADQKDEIKNVCDVYMESLKELGAFV